MATENNEKRPEDRAELSLDELESAAGGYIVHRTSRPTGGRHASTYMVVNDSTGQKIGYANTVREARMIADMNYRWNNTGTEVISEEEYEKRFGRSAWSD